ncbi:chaperonin 10-like protein [Terfezia claveryi]|nr:chaperonin 10-like protein [Terfezia claveryi]
MKAVVFHGPHKIAVEDRPVPKIQNSTDAIVKVTLTGLCGSELHVFRGHQKSDTGFVMGHEFTGNIVELGDGVKDFKVGDKLLPHSQRHGIGKFFYCSQGYSSRCENSLLFGCPKLDGGQAEYVRLPSADGTLFKAPENLPEESVLIHTDLTNLPVSGYFAASNALQFIPPALHPTTNIALIGCGPVGLLFAIDSVPSRLTLAGSLGAVPLNFLTDKEHLNKTILEATNGRGVDAVMEVVGNSPALRMAYDIVRPFGSISSVGVHNTEIPITGNEMYNKKIRIQSGRCLLRAIFPKALDLLKESSAVRHNLLIGLWMPLTQAEEGYELFEKMKVQKVIFKVDKYCIECFPISSQHAF